MVGFLCFTGLSLHAAKEEPVQFELLQVGTETYSNVTVTVKGQKSVLLVHSRGLQSVSLTNLDVDILVKLGYPDPRVPVTNAAVAWVRSHVPAVEMPDLQQARQYLPPTLEERLPEEFNPKELLAPKVLAIILGSALALHLLFSLVLASICRNAGVDKAALIWVPVLQLIPLFKAAQMSPWWFLGLFVPLLNVVAIVMWSFGIAKACGKSAVVALLLLLPGVNLLALLYLAFSGGAKAKSEKIVSSKIRIMPLEAT